MKDIGEYIAEHSTRETEALEWIKKQTHIRTNHARMLTGAVQGRFLKMLAEAVSPRNILEIGTFTGYSAVCLAMALPGDGHLDTLEINDELEDLITEGFARAGVAEKISLVIGHDHKFQLRANNMLSPDIRAGIALLIAAMSARGTSVIGNIEQIDRGYEDIDLRLNALGAHIARQ